MATMTTPAADWISPVAGSWASNAMAPPAPQSAKVMWWKTLAAGYHWSNKVPREKCWIKSGKLNYMIELGNVMRPGCAQKWTIPFLIRINSHSQQQSIQQLVLFSTKIVRKEAKQDLWFVIKNKHDISFILEKVFQPSSYYCPVFLL